MLYVNVLIVCSSLCKEFVESRISDVKMFFLISI